MNKLNYHTVFADPFLMRSRFLKHFVSFFGSALGITAVAFASVNYIAKKNETLSGISAKMIPGRVWGKYGSVVRVLTLNPYIKNKDLIYPGQTIYLPDEHDEASALYAEKKCTQASEPLSKIVGRLIAGPVWGKNGSFEKVIALNPQLNDPDVIHPGQEILLPGGKKIRIENPHCRVSGAQAPEENKEHPSSVPVSAPIDKNSSDGSATSLELTPWLGMTTLTSKAYANNSQSALASNIFAGINARYYQIWNNTFKTYVRGQVAYVSFKQPTATNYSLVSSSNSLTTLGLGASVAILPRLMAASFFDLEQNLFIRAASSNSVTTDSVIIPSLGAQISYDLIQLNAFILSVSADYEEKMPASTDAYRVGLGYSYGGTIEVREQDHGKDRFAVDLGASSRDQDTNVTHQSETIYTLSLKLFFRPAQSREGEGIEP